MKKLLIITLALIGILLVSCEKDESKVITAQTTIDGEKYTPSESSVVNTSKGLILTFTGEGKEIEIVTNDTVIGMYSIISGALKSATILQANLTYSDGAETFYGENGTVEITQNEEGKISGNYEAIVSNNEKTIEIESGSFSAIQISKNSVSFMITQNEINEALDSCYANLNSYIELLYMFDAIYTNNVSAPNSSWNEISDHTLSSTNQKVELLWGNAWKTILVTNNIIESSLRINFTYDEEKEDIIAQAKGIRAYLYYNLLQWFGDIPVELEITETMAPRNSTEEVIEFLIAELSESVYGLPQLRTSGNEFRLTQGFAQLLLTRIFSNKGDWFRASEVAEEIINNQIYQLNIEATNFEDKGPEIILGFEQSNNTEFNSFFSKGQYVPIMRYTEVILAYAEAAYNLGNTKQAIDYINNLRLRREESEITSLASGDILHQWETELDLEGIMFTTLKRYEIAVDELQIPEFKLILPIPHSVLNNNANMTQNPGY